MHVYYVLILQNYKILIVLVVLPQGAFYVKRDIP